MALERNEAPAGLVRVEGFAGSSLVIRGEKRKGAVLIWSDRLEPVDAEQVSALTLQAFEPLFDARPPREVVLIGTGKAMAWPDFAVLEALRNRGIEPEVMDSRAAARTYNLLLSEDRAAAALLLPLS